MSELTISKTRAIEAYDGNAAALARALGVTPSAVYQWPEGPIAERYALKLYFILKPGFFQAQGQAINDASEPAQAVAHG